MHITDVNANEAMLADRLENGIGRDRACVAKVWRAEYRHGGNNSRVFDQIADAYDIAVDRRFRLQTRPLRIGQRGNLRDAGGVDCNQCCKCQED